MRVTTANLDPTDQQGGRGEWSKTPPTEMIGWPDICIGEQSKQMTPVGLSTYRQYGDT